MSPAAVAKKEKDWPYPKEWENYIRVSDVLDCVPKPGLIEWYKRTNGYEIDRISKESMAIGTLTNDLIDAFESGNGKQVEIECDATLVPKVTSAVARYMEWRKTKKMAFISSQVQVCHPLGFCGTIDRLEKEDDGLCIIDWKVSKKLSLVNRMQVIAYKKAYESMHNEKIARCWLARLDKTGVAFNPDKDIQLVDDPGGSMWKMFTDLLSFLKEFRKMEE